jgi:hypothetical protein
MPKTKDLRILQLGVCAFAILGLSVLPCHAGPPYRTDDPEPVALDRLEINTAFAGTSVRGDFFGALPTVDLNYGAMDDVQLHMNLAWSLDKSTGHRFGGGLGDTELGVKYRIIDEVNGDWTPMVSLYPSIDFPTANESRRLGAGNTRAFLPVWIQKSIGDWTSYGGGGYWINKGELNRNYWFAGWLIQNRLTEKMTIGAEIFAQSSPQLGVPGSKGFNLGGSIDLTDDDHLLFSVGKGLTNAATTNRVSFYLGYQLTI